MTTVSIVIPAFNAAEWIADALGSVLAQSYPHEQLDIIVVDDGSTDDTAVAARATLDAGDIRWTVLQQINSGPSRARNVGWQQARGQWIQFLDADDLLRPDKIRVQTAIPEAGEAAVIYSDWQVLRLKAGQWVKCAPPVSPQIDQAVLDLLRAENTLITGVSLFNAAWLKRVGGFDEQRWLIEDVQLTLKLAMAGGVFRKAFSAEPLYLRRDRIGESLAYRDQSEFVDGCVLNAQLVEEHYRANGGLTPEASAVVSASYFQAARYYAGHDAAAFERMARKLEMLQPHFIPPGPAHLRLLSQLIGYRRAERVAVRYRRLKQRAKIV